MTEVVSYYQNQIQDCAANTKVFAKLQQRGAQALSQIGFPTKKDEDWKYTSVDTWLQKRFVEATQSDSTSPMQAGITKAHFVKIFNGVIQANIPSIEPGVIVSTLAEAAKENLAWVDEHLGHILQTTHGFHALNTAMLSKGLVVYVPDNVSIEIPLYLMHWQDKDAQSVNLRHLLVLGENSRATIVEDYSGAEDINYFTNIVTEVCIGKGARLEHYKIQRESKQATHIGHLQVKQLENSVLSHHVLNFGGALVRNDVDVDFRAENAECLLNGVYAPATNQHVDQHVKCSHFVPSCRSEQNYKGVLQGKSRAVFNGTVFVEKNAQHTHSEQQNKNLLLSAQAEIDTKPQLEIFADDVICAHGATVGQLDEDALFYLKARGIDEPLARQLLIDAFAIENFNRMPNAELAQWTKQLFNQQMEHVK